MSVKISELPELDALADADVAVTNDDSETTEANKTKRITWTNIITYILSKLNIWKTISGDTGSTTASGYDDGLTIAGTDPIDTAGTENTLTVSIKDGSTTQKGALQLTNSIASTSITTAACPANVKTAYDLAFAADAVKHSQNTDTELGTLHVQDTISDTDTIIMRDVNGGEGLSTITWAYIKSFLKTYFDTIYSAISHTYKLPTATYAIDHTIITAELGYSMRMDSEDDKIFTLPDLEGVIAYNGSWIEFIKVGTGKLTIAVNGASTDYIMDSTITTGTIYSETQYATLRLEYCLTDERWYITSATGTWITT